MLAEYSLSLHQSFLNLFEEFCCLDRAVSKQPPANLNFILTLLHLVGRIALYKIYFQVRGLLL